MVMVMHLYLYYHYYYYYKQKYKEMRLDENMILKVFVYLCVVEFYSKTHPV